jgi:hypothetical protein
MRNGIRLTSSRIGRLGVRVPPGALFETDDRHLSSGNAGRGPCSFILHLCRLGALWALWSRRHGGMGRNEDFGSIGIRLAGGCEQLPV